MLGPFLPDTPPVMAQAGGSSAQLAMLRQLDRRVLAVSWRLGGAASAACQRTRFDMGWRLHGLNLYRPALRPIAKVQFGLERNRLSVLATAPGGPAAQADGAENDVLVAVAGHSIDLQSVSELPDHEAIERAMEEVDALTDRPLVGVKVLRAGQELDLVVRPLRRCDWSIEVTPSQAISARADGHYISVTSRLVDLADRDDTLAFVLAHEMAHNLQRESPDFATRPLRDRERDADRVGMILAARAGYDTSDASDFVRSLGRISWFSRFGWGAHDAPAVRAAALDRIHEEIATEGAHALPLQLGRPPPG